MNRTTVLTRVFLTTVCMVAAFGHANGENSSPRLGVIDDDFLFRESSVALMLTSKVYRAHKAEIEAVNRLARTAQALEQNLASNKAKVTPAEVKEQQALVAARLAEAVARRKALNSKLSESMTKHRNAMATKLEDAAARVAVAKRLSAVVSKSGLLYNEVSTLETIDITRAVIDELKR